MFHVKPWQHWRHSPRCCFAGIGQSISFHRAMSRCFGSAISPNSLQVASLIRRPCDRAIDLGSGAGFPGLILALATNVAFDLIEADQRKAAFLREAARITGAPVNVHAVRIEVANLPPAPLITARGLAPLPKLLALAEPLLAPGGECLFLKGANVQTELTHAAAQWHMQVQRVPSRTAPDACILRISDLRRVVSSP